MVKVAFIFPGQGSQYPGMGRDLAQSFACARDAFAEADAALGFPISKLCFEGPAEELQLTANTQPAILTVSVAAARILREQGIQADFVAGHSLGEYSALVAGGALQLAEAVTLVRKRGQYMQEAVPIGKGAMAAILGLSGAVLDEICHEAAHGEVVSAANLNSPGQVVIAGSTPAVSRAVEMARGRGAKRAIMLNVSAPFHCALMKPAQDRLSADLDAAQLKDLYTPVVNNVSADMVTTASTVREGLKRQVTAPVRWEESVLRLRQMGVSFFVEVGPGKVLSGLVRQIDRAAECLRVEDMASLNETLAQLTSTRAS
jgi:[acyl-carrier-protein] S-malonyltransferase